MIRRIIVLVLFTALLASCSVQQPVELSQQELSRNWEFRQLGKAEWMPAVVPGAVHTHLLANNIIEDPYFRLNEKKLQWIDKADWEYRTFFIVDDNILERDKAELIFEGLDTYAKIYLNGELLLQADNMFRTWNIDVTEQVREGENELLILLESPTRKGLDALKAFGFQLAADNDQSETGEMGPDRVSPYVRKAPYHFGWDWGPRLVTSGIWRPVWLRAWSIGRINNIYIVTQKLADDIAELSAEIEIESIEPGDYFIKVLPEIGDDSPRISGSPQRNSVKLNKGLNKITIPIEVKQPVFWHPNGSGDQVLYNFQFELSRGNDLIDTRREAIGLRVVRLVQEQDPDGQGKSFYFEVNGKPVFAKGANYIPGDVFLNRVTPEKYEFIIKSAADANMNMLRVWGGGIYEDDLFYDLCDQYGIMVWQDFMYACAMYPGNDAFLDNARLEAVDNVKRLRNNPCIVLWCGNNEIEAAWGPYDENRGWGWKQRYSSEQREVIWKAYDTLFHHILPEVVENEDPGCAYWHSSPSAGMGELASYESTSGDMHYWGVWHGQHPFTDFRKYRSRFMSEYGFQSFPEFNSVKKYTIPEDYNIESEVMMSHQRSGIGNLRIRQYMEEDYHVPADFEQFLYTGQLLQAEAIKMAIESHRSEMPYCMGSLYWQINDCWPVASWSGIDYYGKWKALHYFAREAFKPDVLVLAESGARLKGYIVSDERLGEKLQVDMKLVSFTGNVEWQALQEIEMASPSTLFLDKPLTEILVKVDPSAVVLLTELKKGDIILDTDLHYFVKPKDLKLTEPGIKTEIIEKAGVIEILLTSTKMAKNVFLYADGLDGQFSDNYFDILPGETVSVTIPKGANTLESLKYLEVLHLFKTRNL